ncbi:MAG: transposase, partial [Bacillota bacterium]|nr:transposase [Bacillota bacterium]
MAAIVYQTDKRSGITYAYRSVSHWDKEKQQSRSKRTLIGRVDPDTGEIKPTRKRKNKKTTEINITKSNKTTAKHSFYGATLLFDKIAQKIGLIDDLKNCFPETYNQILSVAYYLILEDR